MKKIVLSLAVLATVALVSCGKGGNATDSESAAAAAPATEEVAPEAPATEEAAAPVEEAAAPVEEAPAADTAAVVK